MQIVIDIPDESMPKIQEDLTVRVQFIHEEACNVGLYDSHDNLIGYLPFKILTRPLGKFFWSTKNKVLRDVMELKRKVDNIKTYGEKLQDLSNELAKFYEEAFQRKVESIVINGCDLVYESTDGNEADKEVE